MKPSTWTVVALVGLLIMLAGIAMFAATEEQLWVILVLIGGLIATAAGSRRKKQG